MKSERTQPRITIPIEVEHFLSSVLGKQSTHGLTGHWPKSVWTKQLKRLIKFLERSIADNVQTDRTHQDEIAFALQDLKDSVNRPPSETLVISALFRLCFLLLGSRPNNWNEKRLNRPDSYLLNRYRTVQFTQTEQQKAYLVLDTFFAHGDEDDKGSLDYMRVYNWRKPTKFLEWFRSKYPNKYLKLF